MFKFLRNGKVVAALFSVLLLAAVAIPAALTLQKVQNHELELPEHSASSEGAESNTDASGGEPEEPEIPWDEVDYTQFFNVPDSMQAMYIAPGVDYLTEGRTSAEQITADIDAAVASVKEMKMNTVILPLEHDGLSIALKGDLPTVNVQGADLLEYTIGKARENGLYVYVVYEMFREDTGGTIGDITSFDADVIDQVVARGCTLASSYDMDGLLLDSYYNPETELSYSQYMAMGGGMGYDNYMRQMSESAFKRLCREIRLNARDVQIGMLTEPVWANQSQNEDGSATNAAFTTLYSGNADNRSYMEKGYVDFVAVKASGSLTDAAAPFKAVSKWWGDQAADAGIPMYIVHYASKACSEEAGWTEYDQLALQLIALESMDGYFGSMFNSLARFRQDLEGSSKAVLDYFSDTLNRKHILTELAVTSPKQKTYTTFEQSVTFMGASDPGAKITINSQEITTDQNGYFTLNMPLEPGLNKFVFTHKGKSDVYNITRQVQVLKEISPTGNLTVDGGVKVTISAIAYMDAKVYATVGGQTIPMAIDETARDESLYNTSYRRFTGTYIAPGSTTSVQEIGNIVVHGSAQGVEDSKQGAYIKVNKKVAIADGVPVRVTAEQAETFPTSVLNDNSDPDFFPLPQGALDYTVGDQMIYKNGDSVFAYYTLASGLRVYSDDITGVSNAEAPGDNAVKDVEVESNRQFTDVIFTTGQQVSYVARYTGSAFTIDFNYTNSVPNSTSLPDNPMFSKMNGSGSKVELVLNQQGRFLGYRAFYNQKGELVFRFNNPPGGLSGATIIVDPGHGGSDVGALGFLPSYPEKVVTRAIAGEVADELESRGANVILLQTEVSPKMDVRQRVAKARNANAVLFISIHCNSAVNNHAATGTEVYYFNAYSKSMAAYSSSAIANAMNTNNRGAKFGRYYVTRDPQFAGVLCEIGFLTNEREFNKLISESYQADVGSAIADAAGQFLRGLGGSSGGGGSLSNGSGSGGGSYQDPDDEEGDRDIEVEDVTLSKDEVTLEAGESITLEATVKPKNAGNKKVKWSSDDTKVAKVNKNGEVTAVSAGEATITVTTVDGEYTADCLVTVVEDSPELEAIVLEETEITLAVGDEYELYAELSPEDATARLLYSSSDEQVVTIDEDGLLFAKKLGSANITVKDKNTGVRAICHVTVIE